MKTRTVLFRAGREPCAHFAVAIPTAGIYRRLRTHLHSWLTDASVVAPSPNQGVACVSDIQSSEETTARVLPSTFLLLRRIFAHTVVLHLVRSDPYRHNFPLAYNAQMIAQWYDSIPTYMNVRLTTYIIEFKLRSSKFMSLKGITTQMFFADTL